MLGGAQIEYVSDYYYLACWVNEISNNVKTVNTLTAVAGWSYGGLLT